MTSNKVCETVESFADAEKRKTLGWTVCNKAFRTAFEERAIELEKEAQQEENPVKASKVMTLVKILRPKRFTGGLLLLGLQHQTIQVRMQQLKLEQEGGSANVPIPSTETMTNSSGTSTTPPPIM